MKRSKKFLSLLLCAIMVLGSVAVGGEGFTEVLGNVLDAFSVKASASNNKYITKSGNMEDFTTQVIINGSASYVSSIKVDGTNYSVLEGVIDEEIASIYKNKKVVFSLENNKIVWISSISDLDVDTFVHVTANKSTVKYKNSSYLDSSLEVYIEIQNTLNSKFIGNGNGLAELEEASIYVSSITLDSRDSRIYTINGKKQKTIDVNKEIPLGKTYTVKETIKINTSNQPEERNQFINYSISAVRGYSSPISGLDSSAYLFSIENQDAEDEENERLSDEENAYDSEINSLSRNAPTSFHILPLRFQSKPM